MTTPRITYSKHLVATPARYPQLGKGEPCKRGETVDKTGCMPSQGAGKSAIVTDPSGEKAKGTMPTGNAHIDQRALDRMHAQEAELMDRAKRAKGLDERVPAERALASHRAAMKRFTRGMQTDLEEIEEDSILELDGVAEMFEERGWNIEEAAETKTHYGHGSVIEIAGEEWVAFPTRKDAESREEMEAGETIWYRHS